MMFFSFRISSFVLLALTLFGAARGFAGFKFPLPAHTDNCLHAQLLSEYASIANPYDDQRFNTKTLQWFALDTLVREDGVAADLKASAQAKIAHYQKSDAASFVARLADMPPSWRIQAAMEYCLETFLDPQNDAELRIRLIRELGNSPYSGTMLARDLALVAAGVTTSNIDEINAAAYAIAQIGTHLRSNEGRNGTPSTDGWQILFNEPIKEVKKIGRGVNGAFLVTFHNGRRGVFKARLTELSFREPTADGLYYVGFPRDATASTIVEEILRNEKAREKGDSQVLVSPCVVTTLIHDGKSYGIGSLQMLQEGFVELDQFIADNKALWKKIERSKEWNEAQARIRTLDYLLGNHDRLPNYVHKQGRLENVMIQVDPEDPYNFKVLLIDNSLGRPGKLEFGIDNAPLAKDIPEDLKKAVLKFDEKKFRQRYQTQLPAVGIDDFVNRVKLLQQRIKDGP